MHSLPTPQGVTMSLSHTSAVLLLVTVMFSPFTPVAGDTTLPTEQAATACGESLVNPNNRIVGGSVAAPGELPWQAGLEWLGLLICGATVISPQWLLSAGHCFTTPVESAWAFTVLLDLVNRTVVSPSHRRNVEKYVLHPRFDNVTYDHDLALIKLDKPLDLVGMGIRPACLPSSGQGFTGSNCIASGWGTVQEGSDIKEKVLRKVDVVVQNRRACARSLSSTYFKSFHICAGSPEGSKDSCKGDSGGPLVCPVQVTSDSQVHWTLAGVISTGFGCGRLGKFGIYMQVGRYLGWIHRVTGVDTGVSEEIIPPVVG
ncbi:transmembrane protease serine 9 [Aplysia californica]|uniref:Transmembrane protease serine 9 n=1 Tax=Aplysia californica TaxID=6500 RepID=A0ABM0JJY7_APLCA|nr:transmembrane protease serine 9 [Aplysia californica]